MKFGDENMYIKCSINSIREINNTKKKKNKFIFVFILWFKFSSIFNLNIFRCAINKLLKHCVNSTISLMFSPYKINKRQIIAIECVDYNKHDDTFRLIVINCAVVKILYVMALQWENHTTTKKKSRTNWKIAFFLKNKKKNNSQKINIKKSFTKSHCVKQ